MAGARLYFLESTVVFLMCALGLRGVVTHVRAGIMCVFWFVQEVIL